MVRAEARPMEAIPAREAIEGIVESFRPRLSRGKIAIDIGFHHAADSIRADRRLLRLAILNLLPIPILDGGHLFFALIECLRGKPISLRKRELAQQVGMVLLVALMLFASYNDILRWMGWQ